MSKRRSVIRWKIYFDRSRMWLSYIQFFLIVIVFLKSFDGIDKIVFGYAYISIPVVLILFVILSLLLGYIDSRLGFRHEELRNTAMANPVMVEMLDLLKDIKEKRHDR